MFNNRLLATITLDKKKFKIKDKDSCIIQTIPTSKTLTDEENRELKNCLNRATELLRESYRRCENESVSYDKYKRL